MKDDNYCLKIYSHIVFSVSCTCNRGELVTFNKISYGKLLNLKGEIILKFNNFKSYGRFFYKIIPVGSTFNSKISVWKFVFSMRMSTVFKKRDFSHLIIKVDTQKTKIGYKPHKWWSTSILYMKFTYYIETYFWQRKKIIVKFDMKN